MHNGTTKGNTNDNKQSREMMRSIINMQVNLEERNTLEIQIARTEPGIFSVDHFSETIQTIPFDHTTKHRISEHHNIKIHTARP